MPRRSADFDENKSPNKIAPMKTTSFYGSSSYVPRYLQMTSSFSEKVNIKTPPKKEISVKKAQAKPKSTRPKGKKFGQDGGVNKGVSHAIKKPKIKKTEKEKPSKSGKCQTVVNFQIILYPKVHFIQRITIILHF